MSHPVVFDVQVLVNAPLLRSSPFQSWPSPPPTSGNPAADCVGIANDAVEFALWLSPHVLRQTDRVLREAYGWAAEIAEAYVRTLVEIALASGGDVVEPDVTVADCADFEDNRILELALAANAALLVSDDTDLLALSPWTGIPIVTARQFTERVDAMRRAGRAR